ncbi:MAG TPA: hypothetical protein PK059_04910 [Cyclobacteriaceae bacterium]|nr:hypothetical protein [Cyclobacteriaceae bacterium]
MRMFKTLLFFVAAMTTGCQQATTQTEKILDFRGMIDRQVDQLSSEQRHLTKVAVMDQNQSDSTFLPTRSIWARELEIFMELELVNKPAYKNAYALQDSIDDPSSNLYIRQYAAPGAPVPLIRLFYRDKDHLKRLEATMLETNLLYSTERKLTLEFDEENKQAVLSQYSIAGFEKMAGSDTIRFNIQGQVN